MSKSKKKDLKELDEHTEEWMKNICSYSHPPSTIKVNVSGRYDVRCHECKGEKVIDVVDEEALHPRMKKRLWQAQEEERAAYWEAEGERMMKA